MIRIETILPELGDFDDRRLGRSGRFIVHSIHLTRKAAPAVVLGPRHHAQIITIVLPMTMMLVPQ